MGCHGNHAFIHSRNKFFFLRLNFFCIQRVPKNKLAPMKHCPGCKVGKIRCWGSICGFTSLRAILDILNYSSIL